MGHSMVGHTTSNLTSGSGAQAIAGANSIGADGPIDVLIQAHDPGIFIGNDDIAVNLPTTGYELTPGVEYRFTFHGSPGAYVATTSGSNVTYSFFVNPHV